MSLGGARFSSIQNILATTQLNCNYYHTRIENKFLLSKKKIKNHYNIATNH